MGYWGSSDYGMTIDRKINSRPEGDHYETKEKKEMNLNRATLIGRLGRDPETSYLSNGTPVCKFSIATSKKWRNKEGVNQEKTEWHNIVVWSKLAELCQGSISKGNRVYVEGEIQTRSWDDKNGGKQYRTEINASSVIFLERKSETPLDAAMDKLKKDDHFTCDDIPF